MRHCKLNEQWTVVLCWFLPLPFSLIKGLISHPYSGLVFSFSSALKKHLHVCIYELQSVIHNEKQTSTVLSIYASFPVIYHVIGRLFTYSMHKFIFLVRYCEIFVGLMSIFRHNAHTIFVQLRLMAQVRLIHTYLDIILILISKFEMHMFLYFIFCFLEFHLHLQHNSPEDLNNCT